MGNKPLTGINCICTNDYPVFRYYWVSSTNLEKWEKIPDIYNTTFRLKKILCTWSAFGQRTEKSLFTWFVLINWEIQKPIYLIFNTLNFFFFFFFVTVSRNLKLVAFASSTGKPNWAGFYTKISKFMYRKSLQ